MFTACTSIRAIPVARPSISAAMAAWLSLGTWAQLSIPASTSAWQLFSSTVPQACATSMARCRCPSRCWPLEPRITAIYSAPSRATTTAGIGLPQPAPSPWKQLHGGDGGPVAFLATTPPQQNFPDNPVQIDPAIQLLSGGHADVTQSTQLQPSFMWNASPSPAVPLKVQGQPDNVNGLQVIVEAVRIAPKVVNAAGELMYAVVAPFSSLSLYGVFAKADGSDIHYEQIGSVSSPAHNDTITGVGTLDGTTVLVGAGSGRIYEIAVKAGVVTAGVSLPVTLPSGVPQGAVERIVVLSATSAFATYNTGWSGRLLKFNGTAWTATNSGLPGHVYFGLECDDLGALVFAAADDLVYVSRDGGSTWKNCSTGLPKQPHCSDLRFARDSTGAGWLHLSTFGWSAWRAEIYPARKKAGSRWRQPGLCHRKLVVEA